jgi:hypothetical protein
MAEHQVESVPLGHVSTAKQATFQVAPRGVRQPTRNARFAAIKRQHRKLAQIITHSSIFKYDLPNIYFSSCF